MLRNRKHEEARKLKGVNHLDEETDLKLGEFTLLQNLVNAEVFSLKKKRGVVALNPCGLNDIITENGIDITTEDGDDLITDG